jgi:hypothetical protein
MKKWLNSIKFIVLIILIIGFVAYNYLTKDIEGFQQTDDDFHFRHFDVSANYYTLSQNERSGGFKETLFDIPFNIGTVFSIFDKTNIPWDSENVFLQPKDVLWGAVAREASADLYNKVYVAKQLKELRIAEDNKFYFDSALLHYGTSDPLVGGFLELGDFMANFATPLLIPELAQSLYRAGGGELEASDASKKQLADMYNRLTGKSTQPIAAKDVGEIVENATARKELRLSKMRQFKRTAPAPNYKFDKEGKVNKPMSDIERIKKTKSTTIKSSALKIAGKMFLIIFDWIELIPHLLTKAVINFVYMAIIMPVIMAMSMPLIAPRKGSVAYVENQVAGVITTLVTMAVTAGASVVTSTIAEATGADPLSKAAAIALQVATFGSAIAGALAAFFLQKDAVPNGYRSVLEKMIESSGHGSGDGKCPRGFMALNELINPTTNIFFSFVPIIGDLFDLMYPYLCVRTNFMESNDRAGNFLEQLVTIRDPYIPPKYLEYHWISSVFLDWPDYNSKYSADTAITQAGAIQYVTRGVGGKKRMVPVNNLERSVQALGAISGANSAPNMTPYYSWINYTNFNDIANAPNEYFNIDVMLEQFNKKLTFEYIGGKTSKDSPSPDSTFRFFYLDFTEPSILVEMAQFYYNFAIKKPFPNDDGTFSVQYITKINYVVASSLFTCDAMCEMVNVTYNPISGEKIKEELSFDSDRRFYFRWRKDPAPTNTTNSCAPITPIWGLDKNDATWRGLDDAYDEAVYRLNDAIHFPTDPTLNGTGLINAELIVSAYEQYMENKRRSEVARNYIFSEYTKTPELATRFSALVAAKNTLDATITALGTSILNTKQLAGRAALTAAQTAYVNADREFNNRISQVQPFFLDLRINTDIAKESYLTVLNKLYTNNENPVIFLNNDLPFDRFNTDNAIIDDLQFKIDAIISAREALWTKHKTDRPVLFNNELQTKTTTTASTAEIEYHNKKYFDVTGCTFIDGAASEVRTPDVANEEEDIRFPVQFDVSPYLKRCSFTNISTDRCIDLSNVDMVIDTFKRQNPTKRIKTIHNIQAKGNNVCQFIWDEVDIAAPAVVSKTTNRILYQQDLSACTFCLPRDSANKPQLYVDAPTATTSIQVVPPASGTTQVLRYNKPTSSKNPNISLQFIEAEYMKPGLISIGGIPENFIREKTSDTMPRYNPVNYYRLPDLVRPKRPIRVTYPTETEAKLANQESNYCGTSTVMSNFMLKYNKNILNTEKILNIQRAFTTSENSCDFEVDVLIAAPKKPDGSEYYGKSFSNILSFNLTTTTIVTQIKPEEYFEGMMIDVRYDSIPIIPPLTRGFVYYLKTDAKDSDGYYTGDYRYEQVTAYSTDSSVKGIFQAIQGERKIIGIDYNKQEITYANDISRLPDNIDLDTIGPAKQVFDPSRVSLVPPRGPLYYTMNLNAEDNPVYNSPGTTYLRFTVARKTISANMTSVGNMTEPFTNTPFTYQSMRTGLSNQGLSIQATTSTLNGEYSNTGFNFNKPINDNTNAIFGPNTNFYNDNLVSNYVTAVSNLRDTSKSFLSNIYNNITLSNVGATTGKKCSDPDIMQRIMDSYNNFSTPTGLFNQEKNTMIQIVQASTDSNNNCHMIFENKNEYFVDYYSYDKFGSNNYTQTNTLMFKRFQMSYDTAVTSFKPDTTSQYFNSTLIASDLALSLGTNLPTYFKSLRTPGICQVDGNNSALYNAFKTDYEARTGNTIISNVKSFNVGFDRTDYLVRQTMRGVTSNIETRNIIRVKYTISPYNGTNNCSWSYTNNSYKVQMVAANSEMKTNLNYPYIQFIDTAPTSLETSDNISPLFMDAEYTGAKPSDVYQRF